MKKIIFLILTLIIASCSEKKDVLEIPLTSDSPEAISILSRELFFKTNDTPGRINGGQASKINSALKEALEIDPNFNIVKALLADSGDILNDSERRSLIESAYKNRSNVSEIEKGLIESIYFNRINGNKVKAAQILEKLVNDNPEYYYLRIYNGNFQNFVMQNPKNAEANWKSALEINPDSNIAKLLISQLHFVTTPDFVLLDSDDIDLEYAISLIKEVEKIQPNNSTPPRLLGNIYRVSGDFDLSLESYKKAMELTKDKKGISYSTLFLISGHVYLFKGEYDKAREYYAKSVEIYDQPFYTINTNAWSTNSYLYEKKYDKAIRAINDMEKKVFKYQIDSLTKYNLLFRCAQEKFIAYGHSQMKDETKQIVNEIKQIEDKIKSLRFENVSSESEKRNIELQSELNQAFFEIWYNILFGEYQFARESLRNFSLLSSEFLSFDSKAMINFYKLSGYLNLMEGNVNQSISFYEQIPTELLEGDNYQLYFYALAKKANGNTKKSNELFDYLANYNFAGWENSIIRPLAKNQIKG